MFDKNLEEEVKFEVAKQRALLIKIPICSLVVKEEKNNDSSNTPKISESTLILI